MGARSHPRWALVAEGVTCGAWSSALAESVAEGFASDTGLFHQPLRAEWVALGGAPAGQGGSTRWLQDHMGLRNWPWGFVDHMGLLWPPMWQITCGLRMVLWGPGWGRVSVSQSGPGLCCRSKWSPNLRT